MIEGGRFMPASITVHPGDRVEWTNKDLFPHTVTATAKGRSQKPVFDSGAIASGASWALTVSNTTGAFDYICIFHLGMKGTMKVTARP